MIHVKIRCKYVFNTGYLKNGFNSLIFFYKFRTIELNSFEQLQFLFTGERQIWLLLCLPCKKWRMSVDQSKYISCNMTDADWKSWGSYRNIEIHKPNICAPTNVIMMCPFKPPFSNEILLTIFGVKFHYDSPVICGAHS